MFGQWKTTLMSCLFEVLFFVFTKVPGFLTPQAHDVDSLKAMILRVWIHRNGDPVQKSNPGG